MIADRLLSIQNLSSIFRICTRGFMKMAIRGCNFKDFCQATWNRCSYPPAAPLAAKTLFSFAKRLPCEILEKKNAMYQRIAQPILSRVLHFADYNFSYLKHPNGAYFYRQLLYIGRVGVNRGQYKDRLGRDLLISGEVKVEVEWHVSGGGRCPKSANLLFFFNDLYFKVFA